MENWQDHGIVLSVRAHGEGGGVASVLTETQGRHAGYVYGAKSSKMRGILEPGNLVQADWAARVSDNLGTFKFELEKSHTAHLLDDPLKLCALQAACAIADKTLPEREPHPAVFHGMLALLGAFETEIWAAAYIYWELGLLKELGFGIDLSQCAATATTENLIYVSPKSGRAVSAEAGAIYKDRMLPLPGFLTGAGNADNEEILQGLELTGYFLQKRVFDLTNHPLPESRLRLAEKYARLIETAA